MNTLRKFYPIGPKRLFTYYTVHLMCIVQVLCILVTTQNLNAQEYFKEDSLYSIYNASDDVNTRAKALIELSDLYGSNDAKKSLGYALQALEEAKKSDDYKTKARAYNTLGINYMNIGSYDRATEYFLESKTLIEKHKDIKRLAGILVNLGAIRFTLGDMEEALEDYTQALELNNKLLAKGDSVYMAQIQAFYINIGSVYERLGNYSAAIEYMNKAVDAAQKNNDIIHLSKATNNLGKIYIHLQVYDLARMNIVHSLKSRASIKDMAGMGSSYLNLTDYFLATNNLDSATIANNEAILMGEQLNSLTLLEVAYQQKAQIYEKQNAYDLANAALKSYYDVKDSLVNESVIENTTRLQMEYEFAKMDDEREREHKIFKVRMFSAVVLLILLLVIFALLYQLWKSRAEQFKTEKKSLEKDLEIKNKELTTNVMYLLKKNELIGNITERLLTLKSKMKPENRSSIQSIIFDLQAGSDSDVWEEFEMRFEQVHNNFYTKLQKIASDLTPSELKICAFLKLGMNSKEIATLIHQSIKSIEVKRSKIRKKLGLTNTDTNLTTFLNQM